MLTLTRIQIKYLRRVESTVEDGVLQQLNCLIPCMCSPEVVIGCVRDV